MYRNTIQFNKYQLPETFSMMLSGINYQFTIRYNHVNDHLYLTIADENGIPLVTNEKLVIGERLFASVSDSNLPKDDLVLIDETGKATTVNFANVNQDAFITIDDTFTGELTLGNTDEGIFNPDGDDANMGTDDDDSDDEDDFDDDDDGLDDLDLLKGGDG